MSQSTPRWKPDRPTGKMVEGISPGVVMGGLIVSVTLAVGGLAWLAGSFINAPIAPPGEETAERAEAEVAAAPSVPLPVGQAENTETLPTPDSGAQEPTLPPTRGYVLLGSKTYLLSRAEAKLSKSRDKIAVVLFGSDELRAPPISLVLELDPRTTACAESALTRYRLIVKLPDDSTTGGLYERTIERRPVQNEFIEIVAFTCERRPGGEFALNLVGSLSPGDGATTPTLAYGLAVATDLR